MGRKIITALIWLLCYNCLGTVAKCHFCCNLKILAACSKKFFRLTKVEHQNLFEPIRLKFSNFAIKAHLATDPKNMLSVIIPAYNEGERIEKTLLTTVEFLKKQPFSYEILVVDDGSTDNTRSTVIKIQNSLPNVRLIVSDKNNGKGYVVKKGMLEARGELRLFMDADNSTGIDQLLPMLKYIDQGFPIVIGSIEAEGAEIKEDAQWYRRFAGHWSKYLIRAVAGLWDIKDTQRGFKLFTKQASEEIFPKVSIKGFGFDIEVLVIAKMLNFKVKEVPVVWNNPTGSKISLQSYLQVLRDLFKIRNNILSKKYAN